VEVVLANPKTSGGARWSFIALWGAVTQGGGSEAEARKFITGVYKNAEVLPKDAREATDTFVKRKKGDVLVNWETESILAKRSGEWTAPYKLFGPNVRTEMPIAVVDKNVDKKAPARWPRPLLGSCTATQPRKPLPTTGSGRLPRRAGLMPSKSSSSWTFSRSAISAAGPGLTRSSLAKGASGIRSSPRAADRQWIPIDNSFQTPAWPGFFSCPPFVNSISDWPTVL